MPITGSPKSKWCVYYKPANDLDVDEAKRIEFQQGYEQGVAVV
jgi:hypothetical protein